ncbi:MAG: hypothetical protein RL701_6150 [Pseudomonadota bacterium]
MVRRKAEVGKREGALVAKTSRPLQTQATPGPIGKRLNPEDRRAQILEVVADLFGQHPYPEISVGDVARAAGVTEGLIYHYFDTRTRLFAAAVEVSCAQLLKACIPDMTQSIPAQFERGVQGYIDYVEAHRMAYLNLFRGPAAHEVEFQSVVDRTRIALIEHIIFALGLADRPVPVTRLSLRGYVAYSEALILTWLEQNDTARDTLERLIYTMILTALSSGLALEAEQPLTAKQLQRFAQDYRAHFGL